MAYRLTSIHDHPRGKVYEIQVDEKDVSVLLTYHVLNRLEKWRLTDDLVVRTMLFPEEVLIGHALSPISAEDNILFGWYMSMRRRCLLQ